jgi:hypothetical protein
VQPILIDGGQLVGERLVEIFDDPRVPLHFSLLLSVLAGIMACSCHPAQTKKLHRWRV